MCSSTHHSSFSEWCVLFFSNLLTIHVVSSKMIIIIIILCDNGDRPSHQAGQVILIQKIILSLHNARNCLSHPCAGHVICLCTDQYPYCRILQSCGWQSHIIWKVPISNQEISCQWVFIILHSPPSTCQDNTST